MLLNYGRNTVRGYWGDLDDVFFWAQAREKDVLNLSEVDILIWRQTALTELGVLHHRSPGLVADCLTVRS